MFKEQLCNAVAARLDDLCKNVLCNVLGTKEKLRETPKTDWGRFSCLLKEADEKIRQRITDKVSEEDAEKALSALKPFLGKGDNEALFIIFEMVEIIRSTAIRAKAIVEPPSSDTTRI